MIRLWLIVPSWTAALSQRSPTEIQSRLVVQPFAGPTTQLNGLAVCPLHHSIVVTKPPPTLVLPDPAHRNMVTRFPKSNSSYPPNNIFFFFTFFIIFFFGAQKKSFKCIWSGWFKRAQSTATGHTSDVLSTQTNASNQQINQKYWKFFSSNLMVWTLTTAKAKARTKQADDEKNVLPEIKKQQKSVAYNHATTKIDIEDTFGS